MSNGRDFNDQSEEEQRRRSFQRQRFGSPREENDYWLELAALDAERGRAQAEERRRAALSSSERDAEDLRSRSAEEARRKEEQDKYWRAYHDHWRNPKYTYEYFGSLIFGLRISFYASLPALLFAIWMISELDSESAIGLFPLIAAAAFIGGSYYELRNSRQRVGSGEYGTSYDRAAFDPDKPESRSNMRPG